MKYLLEIHHGIGDVVQFTGIIESLCAYDPEAYIAIVLNKDSYYDLFTMDDRIAKYYRIDMKGSKALLIKNLVSMRREKYDYFMLSPISNRRASIMLAYFVGAKKSYGEQLKDWNVFGFNSVSSMDVHIVERNNNILKTIFPSITVLPPRLLCRKELPVSFPEKCVGLCIGTSIPQKTWSLDKYIQLANELNNAGYQIVLLGGKKEENVYNEVVGKNEQWIDLLGKVDLCGSATACKQCELIIGGDTGVMHIAAAMNVKTLTLFSCTDPRLHSPYSEYSYFYNVDLSCQFCYEQGDVQQCKDYKCIRSIEVKEVAKLANSILNGTAEEKYHFKIRR